MDENNQENAEQKVVNEENTQTNNTAQAEVKQEVAEQKVTSEENASDTTKSQDEAKQDTAGADGYTSQEKETGKAMAILSYIGFLSLIPYLTEKENKWVKYHATQGINLVIIWVGLIVISVIGICNVCNGEAKELPLVGKMKMIK